jgi:hypothetical protein
MFRSPSPSPHFDTDLRADEQERSELERLGPERAEFEPIGRADDGLDFYEGRVLYERERAEEDERVAW